MMSKLAAEEELLARAAAAHPHLDPKDQKSIVNALARMAGVEAPAQKPTRADMSAIGIKVLEGGEE